MLTFLSIRTLAVVFGTILVLISQASSASEQSFSDTLQERAPRYHQFADSDHTQQLYSQGKLETSVQQLISLVPDDDKDVYDYFILANMLYVQDPDRSYQYMKTAEQLAPDVGLIALERGIHEHRNYNFAEAQTYYLKYLSSTEQPAPSISAYLAHTYLMTGQPEAALEAWAAVDFSNRHTAIEKSMYTIFSKANQDQDRSWWISQVESGDIIKLCDLWRLDSNWEFDWWNYREKTAYLAFDQTLADTVLTNDAEIGDLFRFYQAMSDMDNETLMSELERLGITSGPKHFPESAAFVYGVLEKLVSNQLMSADEFLANYESQILDYAAQNPLEQRYYDVLGFLYVTTENYDRLQAIDRYGWKELGVEKFASSYIAGLDTEDAAYQQEITAALKQFPNSVTLNRFAYIDDADKGIATLSRFVASQFADVKNNWAAQYRLNDYMNSLIYELQKIEASENPDSP